MTVVLFLTLFLLANGTSIRLMKQENPDDQLLTTCVIDILNKYFIEEKQLTIVLDSNDDMKLQDIYSKTNASFFIRRPFCNSCQYKRPHAGYVFFANNSQDFTENFRYLVQEPFWNPSGKFLVVISTLQGDLRVIFNVLLMFHVNDVVLLNGAGYLYTYNPFANYACGKYYDEIIGFGMCLNNRANLFPDKLFNGLRNCSFRVTFPHKPPYTVHPSVVKHLLHQSPLIGFEEKLLKVLAEREHFNITYNESYGKICYSVILPNMTAVGPLSLLQTNETDIVIGGMMLSQSRYSAFSHVSGHFDYLEEFFFAVRKADLVPSYKKIYLEFQSTVWLLLIFVFIIFFILLIIVLRPKDKSLIMLKMLSSLVLHECGMSCRYTVKWVVLMWLLFAVIINIFYQTSLYSLTNNPIREHQIDEEHELNNFKACIEPALIAFLRAENIPNNITLSEDINDCDDIIKNIHRVGQNRKMYTLFRKMMFEFNKDRFTDPWGHSPIHMFTKPLCKTIAAILLYKGFPTTHQLKVTLLRLIESGLVNKFLEEHMHLKKIKFVFPREPFRAHVIVPWNLFAAGCILATITFFLEMLYHRRYKKIF